MAAKELPREVLAHPGEWVLLSYKGDRLLAFGKKPEDVLAQRRDGVLLWVPEDLWAHPSVPSVWLA